MRAALGAHLFKRVLVIAAFLPLAFPLAAYDGEGGYQLLELDGYKVKWGEQQLGAGASVSYALADERLSFDDARNCPELAPIKTLSGENLPEETLLHEIAAAFRVWEGAAGLSFHRVRDAGDADIVIGAQGQPRGRAFANVSYVSDPEEGKEVRAIEQAQVCLNPERRWKVGFDGNREVYDIRYTLIHEIGHAIGLDHPGASGQLMAFRYTETFNDLQPGDLQGVRRLYGHGLDDSEPSNDASTQLAETASNAFRLDDLIGNAVISTTEDKEIGSIKDLIVDPDGGIVAVVVGGFLGLGEKNVALRWDSVELARDGDGGGAVIRVDADRNSLDSAPEYEGAS